MRLQHIVGMSIAVATLFWVSIGWAQPSRPQELALFSPEEAAVLRFTAEEFERETDSAPPSGTRSLSRGPVIVVQKPQITGGASRPTLETASPTDIIILFQASHAPVNMDSLQVQAKKGWFTKSLTDRLKPFVQGAQLAAKGIDIPQGRFLIQIAIADQQGAETVETYRLTVK